MVRMNVPDDDDHDLVKTLQRQLPMELFNLFLGSIERAKQDLSDDLAMIAFVSIWNKTSGGRILSVEELLFNSFIIIHLPGQLRGNAEEMTVIFEYTSPEYINVIPCDRLQQIGSLIFWQQHDVRLTVNSWLKQTKHNLRWMAKKETLASIVTLYYSQVNEVRKSKNKYSNVPTAVAKAEPLVLEALENWDNVSFMWDCEEVQAKMCQFENYLDASCRVDRGDSEEVEAATQVQAFPEFVETNQIDYTRHVLQEVILRRCFIPLSCITHYLCNKLFYVTEFLAWLYQTTVIAVDVAQDQEDNNNGWASLSTTYSLSCQCCGKRMCPPHASLATLLRKAPCFMLYHHKLYGIEKRNPATQNEFNWSDLFQSDKDTEEELGKEIYFGEDNYTQCAVIGESYHQKRQILADAVKVDCNNSNILTTRSNSIALSSLCFRGSLHETIQVAVHKRMMSVFESQIRIAKRWFGLNSKEHLLLLQVQQKAGVDINNDTARVSAPSVVDFNTIIHAARPFQSQLDKHYWSLTNTIANLPHHESWDDWPADRDIMISNFTHKCPEAVFGVGNMETKLVEQNEQDDVLNMLSWYSADKIIAISGGEIDEKDFPGVYIPEALRRFLEVVANETRFLVVLTRVSRTERTLLLSASSKHRNNLSFFIPTNEFLQFIPKGEIDSLLSGETKIYAIDHTIKEKFRRCVDDSLLMEVKEISLHCLFPQTVYRVVVGDARKTIFVDQRVIQDTTASIQEPWYLCKLIPSLLYSSTGCGIKIGAGKKRTTVRYDTDKVEGTKILKHNFWFDRRNAQSLCVEGAVANWLFSAGLETVANDIKLSTSRKNMYADQTENLNVILQFMQQKHHIWHQRLELKYETVVINPRNVAWLRHISTPILLLLKSPCALQTHAVVVWEGFVYDFQEKTPYEVTFSSFQNKCLAGGELYMIRECYAFFSPKYAAMKYIPTMKLSKEELETCPFLMPKCLFRRLKMRKRRKKKHRCN